MGNEPLFRTAFCILCHKFTPVLQELVDRLAAPGNDIYLHVDGKTSLHEFAALKGKVHFVEPRVKVYWGQASLTECMLRLLRATRNSDCRYIVLLSGDTLPLRDTEEIREFFQESYAQGREFVDMEPSLWIAEVHKKLCRNHYCRDKSTFGRRVAHVAGKLFRPARNKRFHRLPPLEKGSNWIAVTDRFRDCVLEYLSAHPVYTKAFRHAYCSDEFFFQTLIGSSPFAGHNCRFTPMFVRWAEGDNPHPLTLETDDLPMLAALRGKPGLPFLFARKIADDIDLNAYRRLILQK